MRIMIVFPKIPLDLGTSRVLNAANRLDFCMLLNSSIYESTGVRNQIFIATTLQFLPVKIMANKTLTAEQGIPVTDNQNPLTAGQRGPVITQNVYPIEKQEMTL